MKKRIHFNIFVRNISHHYAVNLKIMKAKRFLNVLFVPVACLCFWACGMDSDLGAIYMPEMSGDAAMPEEPGEPVEGDKFDEIVENEFINTADQNVSTFSIDADGASYAYMRKCLRMGIKPSPNAVRIEEYLNYFTFDYEEPSGNHTVAINGEIGECPWNPEHKLMRLGIKGKSIAVSQMPAANYVFLIDVSGSMNQNDKLPLLKEGLMTLTDRLNPTDRVSIVTYSGTVKLLLESTLASDAASIKKAISKLGASGSTAGGAALKMAYEEALSNYIEGGNNRVIMGTDGDFNVGVTSTEALVEMVQDYAAEGIYLTVCGFGSGNLNDHMMEEISNKGNGTYEYIDSEDELSKVFVNERSKFQAVANDSKVQVTFDKEKVDSYRLIGYENRVMANEDFEDDTKDAGEIGAGQTITALYEIVPGEKYMDEGAIAVFDFRYKKALGEESIPLSLDVQKTLTPDVRQTELRFAAGVAAYGLVLRDSRYKGSATFDMAYELMEEGLAFDNYGYRAQLRELVTIAKGL